MKGVKGSLGWTLRSTLSLSQGGAAAAPPQSPLTVRRPVVGASGVECPGAFALHWRPQPTKATWPQLCVGPGFFKRPWKGIGLSYPARLEPPALVAPGPLELPS